jgi:predicted Zn-dependent protease
LGITIGILSIGNVDPTNLVPIKDGLPKIFPKTATQIVDDKLPLSPNALDKQRGQYRSNQILAAIQVYAQKTSLCRVLGVLDEDIFVPDLNFVFGEATFPGNSALISLRRLRPEFHREPPNLELFAERAVKEAVHEVGHTLGLKHCHRLSCVMHFSNSIFDTDKKQRVFCDECFMQAAIAIDCLK